MGTSAKQHKEAALDPIVEAGLLDTVAVRDVPAELQRAMTAEELIPFTHIRFHRITPRRQGQITDLVMRRYHKDLQDPDLLSDERIMALASGKGAWTSEQDARIAELQEITTGQLASLYQEGVVRSDEWAQEVEDKSERFIETVREAAELTPEQRDDIGARLKRWLLYSPDKQAEYTARYAEGLGAPVYHPDKDLSWLLDQAPTLEGIDILNDVEELRDKIDQYLELRIKRFELDLLVRKRTEIFSNSVESRQRNAGQMARLFFTSEQSNASGVAAGPVAATFDELYNFPPELISWLIEEQFFFHNNIPPAAREALQTLGFRKAAEVTTTSDGPTEPSDASPDPSPLSNDSPLPATTDADSSESVAPTS